MAAWLRIKTLVSVGVVAFGLCGFPVKAIELEDIFGKSQLIDCQKHDEAQEATDMALARKAFGLMQTGNIAALTNLLPELEAALARAPDRISLPERCGDDVIVYGDSSQALAAGLMAAVVDGKKNIKIVQRDELPYGSLGYIIGWIYVEKGDLPRATLALEKGMKNTKDSPSLVAEYATVLSKTQRSDEAVKVVDEFLTTHEDLDPKEKAVLLRRRGYALVELGRLEEALKTYEESLKLDPKSELARSEIQYIKAQLKAQPKGH